MKRTLQNHILDTFSPIGKPYQKEFLVRNIYGSSRIGATKEAVNMQNPSLLPSYGILGNRNYELSDHRGNVQTVINDIKYPIESNGSITSYEVGISSISDYSPFGVELDGRTIENIFHYPNSSVDTLFVSDTLFIINNDFENPTITTNGVSTFIDGWKDFSQSTISIENTGGNNQLKVVSTNGTHGIHQTFAIENGETYTFEVDLTKVSVPSGVVNVVIYQGPSPGVPYSVHVLSSNGTNTFSYTANSSDIYVQIRQKGTYLLDNIRLYREYEDTVIVGGYAASGGYRYSFQNQEKHDEIRGKGKYINYKYRGYDPRVGRLDWMVDPLADSYPWNSPYAFSENRVLDGVELEGLEFVPSNDMKRIDVYIIVSNHTDIENDFENILNEVQGGASSFFSDENTAYNFKFIRIEELATRGAELPLEGAMIMMDLKNVKTTDDNYNGTTSYKGGEAPVGQTINANFNLTVSTNGNMLDIKDIINAFIHEIGHLGGLRHPWEEENVDDIKQPDFEDIRYNMEEKNKFRNNFMNSGKNSENKLKPSGSMTPKTKTEGQSEEMKKTIKKNYDEYKNSK
ncbi:MAG: hypothetical protein M9897_05670 [Brumimicrobium sp.]|nr:hypothetical protein [Brumimicrobium sp.]